ncbi:hypothetical protein EDC94DRAFT_660158 [Helicostylum pulchrum]|nr:hypothetical protein EDC94DRAFT_660158 [Helicostylum pulchrum]
MSDYTSLRRFGNEIHRISINQAPTYDDLCLIMYRTFKTQITSSENIELKYIDNEGDLISLLDDNDIIHAISISNLLNIAVYDKSSSITVSQTAAEQIPTTLQNEINDLKKSVRTIQKQMANIDNQEPSKPGPGRRVIESVVSQIEKSPFIFCVFIIMTVRAILRF